MTVGWALAGIDWQTWSPRLFADVIEHLAVESADEELGKARVAAWIETGDEHAIPDGWGTITPAQAAALVAGG